MPYSSLTGKDILPIIIVAPHLLPPDISSHLSQLVALLKREMKSHLLAIHNAFFFSEEWVAGKTFNDRTTDTMVEPAISDHLMPGELSENSECVEQRAKLAEIRDVEQERHD